MSQTFNDKPCQVCEHRSGRVSKSDPHGNAHQRDRRSFAMAALLVCGAGAACGDNRSSHIDPDSSVGADGSMLPIDEGDLQGVPLAFVANQDDTTVTTIRLDGKGTPVINTLPIGPPQSDAIGGMAFSSGEWLFVTNTATNWVATIDPRGKVPIFEEYLTENKENPLVKIGQRPTRIYLDPVDKEVVWTVNDGDPATGIDTIGGCGRGGSVSALHNSHLGAGGKGPHVMSKVCLDGKGPHDIAFLRSPLSKELAFVSSKATGLVNVLLPISGSGGSVAWGAFPGSYDLCDSAKEVQLGYLSCDAVPTTPNHASPTGVVWSAATETFYSYLSGYHQIAELDPRTLKISRRIEVGQFDTVEIVPGGRFLVLFGVDETTDPTKVVAKVAFLDLTAVPATVVALPVDNVRPRQFRFTPDGKRLYLALANDTIGLTAEQAAALKVDKLIEFDTTNLPAVAVVREIELPAVGALGVHGLDVWASGPNGSGSTTGIVVTNGQTGSSGTVSLIDPGTGNITATIPVGKNPRQVVVYYTGLAASDNQATPTW